jgi:FAD-linked oxidoreductase
VLLLKNETIHNWSSSVSFSPEEISYPESMEEVVEIVHHACSVKKSIRVMGARHSFTPLIRSNHLLLSLDKLSGVINIDHQKRVAEVWAGTRLYDLSEYLYKHGYAQENLGDINVQSVAGAFVTGTHGTGANYGIIASQLEEITLVLANGEVLTCTREHHSNFFHAAGVSLGMLGIIVKVKIRVVPSQTHELIVRKEYLKNILQDLNAIKDQHDHVEFYLFPYSENIQLKTMNPTNLPPQSLKFEQWKTNLLENKALFLVSEFCRLFPKSSPKISNLMSKLVSDSKLVGPSHELFCTPRNVRFQEMEYSIPDHFLGEVIERIHKEIPRQGFQVNFPIECRFVKGDEFWLSPAHGRNSAYIALHMYKGMEHKEYFRYFEAIIKEYEGRPHWGKMHTLNKAEIQQRYPMLDDFLQLRQEVDPDGLFLNEYLRSLFL